jgi:hypothetical protein
MPETTPRLVRIAGAAMWRFADGRLVPLAAGGDDDDPEGEGKPEGDGKPDGKPDGEDDPAAKARREAAELRRKLRAAEKERDDLRAATQTDAERLAARAEAAEGTATAASARARKLALRLAVVETAGEVGIVDPKLAYRLLDTDTVEYGDDDEPDRDALLGQLKKLAEEHGVLTRGGDSDAGRRGTGAEPSGKDAINDWLRGGKAPAAS